MEVSAYICNWARITEEWQKQGPDIYLGEYIDEEADWIKEDSFTIENDSMIFNSEVGELFMKSKQSLPKSIADCCENFLVAFSPGLESDRFKAPQCLGVGSDVIYSSLDPETVQIYSKLAHDLDISLVANEIVKQALADENDLVGSSEEVIAFIRMWQNAMNEAVQENRGMLIFCG